LELQFDEGGKRCRQNRIFLQRSLVRPTREWKDYSARKNTGWMELNEDRVQSWTLVLGLQVSKLTDPLSEPVI